MSVRPLLTHIRGNVAGGWDEGRNGAPKSSTINIPYSQVSDMGNEFYDEIPQRF